MAQTNFNDNVVITGSRDVTQLEVIGNTAQSSALQEWKNSGGTVLARVYRDGAFLTAGLEIDTNVDGLVISRLTTAERNSLPGGAPSGMIIYNSDTNVFEVSMNGIWRTLVTRDLSETLTNKSIVSSSLVDAVSLTTAGQVIFNDAGANFDFRVEGDTADHLLFADASTDRIGIKNSSPTVELDVTGEGLFSGKLVSLASIIGNKFYTGTYSGNIANGATLNMGTVDADAVYLAFAYCTGAINDRVGALFFVGTPNTSFATTALVSNQVTMSINSGVIQATNSTGATRNMRGVVLRLI